MVRNPRANIVASSEEKVSDSLAMRSSKVAVRASVVAF
jgi:hypothetical protein